MNSTYKHVSRDSSHCTSSTLDTRSSFLGSLCPFIAQFSTPRAARNRRRAPKEIEPAFMDVGQLLALPRQTLVLLASAHNLVATGTKALLAERIYKFEHRPNPAPVGSTNAAGANTSAPQPLLVTVDNNPTPMNAFSDTQMAQLQSLISAAVQSGHVGS